MGADMDYRLIALDMDGTLLDSGKRVRPDVSAAVREAAAAGRHVAICSGRCPSMVELSRDDLGDVRYAICGSGTALYDLLEHRMLEEFRLPHECVLRAIDACAGADSLFEVFHANGFLYEEDALERMPSFGLGVYVPEYRAAGTCGRDLRRQIADPSFAVQKLNVHFRDAATRERVRTELLGLPLGLTDFEEASLELSPAGIDKGTGLRALAALLGVPAERTIAVGDADNDLPMLRAAGLAVAMGNANDSVRDAADVVVADNDHDGVAEAIRRYLLG